jgi:hypothetical protein
MARLTIPRKTVLLPLLSTLVIATACASGPPPGQVYIVDRPPPERVEVIPVAPGPSYVWVAGYWSRDRQSWNWVPGRWVSPESRYRAWAPGHWARSRRGWYYIDGHWR